MSNEHTERAPKDITVYFQYEKESKKPFYSLVTPDISIEMVELESIYRYLDDNETRLTDRFTVQYWEPTTHGAKLVWLLSGKEFLERSTLESY